MVQIVLYNNNILIIEIVLSKIHKYKNKLINTINK